MAIQYAGGSIISSSLTQSTGTRAELAQWVRDELILAGWTSSGSATDYQLTSATTPQSLVCRVRSYDSGSGSCARLKFSNTGGTKTQAGDLFLLPAAAKVWRFIGNKYQFFIFTPGTSATREFACGGVPYLPSFLNTVITEGMWGACNALTDTATTLGTSFRTRLTWQSATGGNNNSNQFGLVNGSSLDTNGGNAGGSGLITLATPSDAYLAIAAAAYRWHDDSLQVVEPLIAWGLTAATDEAKIRGQLWDSVVITDSFAADTTITLDSRTYWAITGINSGTAGTYAPGTLFVAVT